MLLLLLVTTVTAAAIVGLSWSILLASHGYFAVAPLSYLMLRV